LTKESAYKCSVISAPMRRYPR